MSPSRSISNEETSLERNWIENYGNYADAIAFARLFWPEFKVYNDCVVFDEINQSRVIEVLQAVNHSRTAVETVLNSRYIAYLFAEADPSPSHGELVELGRFLKEMWQAKLNRDFPNRHITVVFYEGTMGSNFDHYEITFFQNR